MKNILEKYCTLFCTDLYEFKNMTFLYTENGVYFYIQGDESYETPFTDEIKLETFILALP